MDEGEQAETRQQQHDAIGGILGCVLCTWRVMGIFVLVPVLLLRSLETPLQGHLVMIRTAITEKPSTPTNHSIPKTKHTPPVFWSMAESLQCSQELNISFVRLLQQTENQTQFCGPNVSGVHTDQCASLECGTVVVIWVSCVFWECMQCCLRLCHSS
mmetsp:Transcript_33232/g.76624  ORF Transcript_33232/g.76624 Transcript_33232/m.76624 type:complete len:157 (-) Transcript_33232:1243-1713(-)